MRASSGDWLMVRGTRDGTASRCGEILATSSGGAPPYTIHWVDTGRTALVFPGPDAVVVSAGRRADRQRRLLEQTSRVQAEILAHRHG